MNGRKRNERGAALAELAVALPVLLLVLIAATDLGRIAYLSMLASNAASAGVGVGVQSSDMPVDVADIERAARDDFNAGAPDQELEVEAERFCTCAPSDAATACDSACPAVSGYPAQPRIFVRVRVETSFETLFAYPGIRRSVPIVREAQMRAS